MRKLRLRKKIYFKIKRFFKIPEGSLLPKYMIVLKCILFPLQMFYYFTTKNLRIEDIQTDSFKIFGIKYSAELFQSFAKNGISLNVPFTITNRDNNFITIQRFYKITQEEHLKAFNELKNLSWMKKKSFEQYIDLINILSMYFHILKK